MNGCKKKRKSTAHMAFKVNLGVANNNTQQFIIYFERNCEFINGIGVWLQLIGNHFLCYNTNYY